MDEKQRIQQIKRGDTAAFAYFVDTYKDMAISIAYRICHNQDEAEDIAQMAFVKAFKNLHTFKNSSKFSTWFYRIVYNTGISEIQKTVHKVEFIDYEQAGLDTEHSEYDALSIIAQKERIKTIQTALAKIPKMEAVALTLFYLEENSIKEVAQIMSLTPENVKESYIGGERT